MRKQVYIQGLVLILLSCWNISKAQPATDSIYQQLSSLPAAEKVAQINDRFYELYSLDFEFAKKLGTEALEISRSAGWTKWQAASLKNLGIVNYLQGNHEQALQHYQEAQSLFEQLNDPTGLCSVLNEMGVFFSRRGQFDRSKEILQKAGELCHSAGDSIGWSNAMDNLGLAYMRMGEFGPAERQFQQVLALRERLQDSLGLSYVLNNLASIAIEQDKIDTAMAFIQRSTQLREALNDRQGVAININNMGEAWLRAGNPQAAIGYFKESLERSRELAFVDLERHILEMLAQSYEQAGDAGAALDWLRQSHLLKDSLYNQRNAATIAEMQEKYESEKREKELSRKALELRKRDTWLALALLGILSLVAFLLLMRRQHRQKQAQLKRESALKASLAEQETANRLQQERLRISRDLHDHLGAELSVIRSGIATQLYHKDQPVDTTALQRISDNTRKAMDELRETIWAIRGDGDNVQRLAEKLQDFAGRFEQLNIQVQHDEAIADLTLSPGQSLNLYRIFQEAIHNAAKHAPDAPATLHFQYNGHGLQITFSDHGAGFDVQQNSRGYGLANMQQRATEIDADFELESGEQGTTVRVKMRSET